MKLSRRIAVKVVAGVLAASVVSVGAWGVWRWATYPDVPEVGKVDLNAAVDFMGTDDFNRMLESHRKAYAMSVVDELGRKSISDLLAMGMQRRDEERQKRIVGNIRQLRDHEEIGDRLVATFLDKFYKESEISRAALVATMVTMQNSEVGRHPERFHLPTVQELKKGMTRFMTRQPPRVQAQMTQLMLDIRRYREARGFKDPW